VAACDCRQRSAAYALSSPLIAVSASWADAALCLDKKLCREW